MQDVLYAIAYLRNGKYALGSQQNIPLVSSRHELYHPLYVSKTWLHLSTSLSVTMIIFRENTNCKNCEEIGLSSKLTDKCIALSNACSV